jgi:hypothetical protein
MTISNDQAKSLNNACVPLQKVLMGYLVGGFGSYSPTAAEASASSVPLCGSASAVTGFIVQVTKSGSTVAAGDPKLVASGSRVTVMNGTTYVVAATDVINYIIW